MHLLRKFALISGSILVVISTLFLYIYNTNQKLKTNRNIALEGVLAFTKQRSYTLGDTLKICVHSAENQIGKLYKLDSVKIYTSIKVEIPSYLQDNFYNSKVGFSTWKENLKIPTSTLKSGLYSLELQNKKGEKTFALPIVIEDKTLEKIVVISNTYSWQCYNIFGGLSNYVDEVTPYILKKLYAWKILLEQPKYLTWYRPNKEISEELLLHSTPYETISKTNLGSRRTIGEWSLLAYLYKKKIKFSLITDDNFTKRNDLEKSQLIIIQTHAEYWTNEMLGKLKYAENLEKNIAIFAGNTAFRTIQKEENNTVRVINQANNIAEITPLIGTFYNEANYQYFAPYEVLLPNHWVFEGANLHKGEIFGTDYGSGFETDQINIYSSNYTLLAQGKNEYSPAHMVIKENTNGAFVFNASSILSAKSIANDSTLQLILHNLIKKSLNSLH